MKTRSPKLEAAMQEIKKLLEMYDIAGIVFLHTPQVGEYLIKLEASYSIATLNATEGTIQIKTNPNNTNQEKQKSIADTSNMLRIFAELLLKNGLAISDASTMLDAKVDATHTPTKNITKPEKEN